MGPDYWFVIAGAAALCMGIAVIARALFRRTFGAVLTGSLWLCLSAGLLLQGFSPHPQIRGGAFALPEATEATGSVDPITLVDRTRGMHQMSLLATLMGVFGLGFCYRRQLFEPHGSRNA
jgi:hypothetical protein